MSWFLCLSVKQQFVQQNEVHSMFHHKLTVQVEDRYVPPVPVQPQAILWKTDVHLLQHKLWRERERSDRTSNIKLNILLDPSVSTSAVPGGEPVPVQQPVHTPYCPCCQVHTDWDTWLIEADVCPHRQLNRSVKKTTSCLFHRRIRHISFHCFLFLYLLFEINKHTKKTPEGFSLKGLNTADQQVALRSHWHDEEFVCTLKVWV